MTVSTRPGRYLAWKTVKRFLARQPYQPNIDCAHRPSRLLRNIDGVCGQFRVCRDCGLVIGVLGR